MTALVALERSELPPPFTGAFFGGVNLSSVHLTAPGRCQPLYILLRVCRDLCFY